MATRILYVEDETFLAKIVTESLESRGYEIRWVDDGAAAMPAFNSFDPDICVLDIMLPNQDGYAIAREIKQQDSNMPVIFLTAKSQTEDVLEGFGAGGNDYLKKPFSVEELIVRMENLLSLASRNHRAPVNDTVELGKFSFDARRMTLSMGEEKRKLSHREVELLKLLAEYRNLPIERRKILMTVWGDDNLFNSRNLDVYITRLRKYFKPDPNLQILTLKGVGYQFVTE